MVAKKKSAKRKDNLTDTEDFLNRVEKKGRTKKVHKIAPGDEPQPRPEQAEFEGMETPSIPEVEKKAKEHAGYKDRAKPLNDKSKEAKAELITLMIQHDLKTYNRHGVHIQITETLDAKVEID